MCYCVAQVDVRDGPELATSGHEVFLDQINVSDVIVGSKSDLADEDQQQRFETWAASLWPRKAQVGDLLHACSASSEQLQHSETIKDPGALHAQSVSHVICCLSFALLRMQVVMAARGEADSEQQLLQLPRDATSCQSFFSAVPGQRRRQQQRRRDQGAATGQVAQQLQGMQLGPQPSSDDEQQPHGAEDAAEEQSEQPVAGPLPRQPLCFVNVPPDASGHVACGWLFHPGHVFDRQQLVEVLRALRPLTVRLKGIFR
jgi:G3E family GTPase